MHLSLHPMQFRLGNLLAVVTASAVAVWLLVNYPCLAIVVLGSFLAALVATTLASRRTKWKEMLAQRLTFRISVAVLSIAIFSLYFLSSGPVILLMRTFSKPDPNDPIQNLIFAFYAPLFIETQNPLEPFANWYVSQWIGDSN